jgi:pimeloyl-ACP methyl ester carboxylesterase
MHRIWIAFLVPAALLLLLAVVPFLIPVPPLQGTVPPEVLADVDSRFIDVDGLRMHYKQQGQGEPALVLLHGFGASTFSWREVMPQLSALGTTVAFDRPAFGLTQRPMPGEWQGESPYSPEAQADQTIGLMDSLGIDRAVLVGHSAGGTAALLTTLRHPDRVQALVLVDPAIYRSGAPGWLGPLLRTPQMRRLGPLVARSLSKMGDRLIDSAWYDPSRVTADVIEGYRKPLRAQDWDRALWEVTLASHPLHLEERLGEVRVPVLVITGDHDQIVPSELSARLAEELPNAELVVIPECGHIPQEERPGAFLSAVSAFLAGAAAKP